MSTGTGPDRRGSSGADMARGATEASRWLAIPIGFVVWLSVFFLAGRWADNHWGWNPWGELVGALIGWAVGLTYVFYAVKVARQTGGERR